jgi:hypothetical protein
LLQIRAVPVEDDPGWLSVQTPVGEGTPVLKVGRPETEFFDSVFFGKLIAQSTKSRFTGESCAIFLMS